MVLIAKVDQMAEQLARIWSARGPCDGTDGFFCQWTVFSLSVTKNVATDRRWPGGMPNSRKDRGSGRLAVAVIIRDLPSRVRFRVRVLASRVHLYSNPLAVSGPAVEGAL